jgi:hypothetical protein
MFQKSTLKIIALEIKICLFLEMAYILPYKRMLLKKMLGTKMMIFFQLLLSFKTIYEVIGG